MNASVKASYDALSYGEEKQTARAPLHGARGNAVLKRASDFLERISLEAPQRALGSSLETPLKGQETFGPLMQADALEEEIGNVIRFSAPRTHPERPLVSIVAVQEWEGVVDQVLDDYFEATLVDVSVGARHPTEVMEIPLDLIDEEDRRILRPGTIFRLVIGRERRKGGQIQNKTLVYVRRNQFRKRLGPDVPGFGDLISEWK